MTQTIHRRARELLAKQYEGSEYARVLRTLKGNKYLDGSDIKAIAALTEALARIEELEGALKPFAEAADDLTGSQDDDAIIAPDFVPRHDLVVCTVGDLRRAAAVMGE